MPIVCDGVLTHNEAEGSGITKTMNRKIILYRDSQLLISILH